MNALEALTDWKLNGLSSKNHNTPNVLSSFGPHVLYGSPSLSSWKGTLMLRWEDYWSHWDTVHCQVPWISALNLVAIGQEHLAILHMLSEYSKNNRITRVTKLSVVHPLLLDQRSGPTNWHCSWSLTATVHSDKTRASIPPAAPCGITTNHTNIYSDVPLLFFTKREMWNFE